MPAHRSSADRRTLRPASSRPMSGPIGRRSPDGARRALVSDSPEDAPAAGATTPAGSIAPTLNEVRFSGDSPADFLPLVAFADIAFMSASPDSICPESLSLVGLAGGTGAGRVIGGGQRA